MLLQASLECVYVCVCKKREAVLGLQLDYHGNHKCSFEPENMQRIFFVFPQAFVADAQVTG